jgi:hypothetical protein
MSVKLTTNLASISELDNTFEEFIRTERVKTRFGIKRGTLYNLFNDGKIKGKVLRVRGNVTGVRLWDVESIRDYIRSLPDDDLKAAA